MKIAKYYHTLRYLKTKQIYYQVYYKLRRTFRRYTKFNYPLTFDRIGCSRQLTLFPPKFQSFLKNDEFIFLNLRATFTNWNDARSGMLWTYNLNYMDYLLQKRISVENGKRWINRFIENLKTNSVGLDSYPIALRGINWIKFISIHQDEIDDSDKKRWDSSLYAQYQILLDNIEYHLMGNHLLEDAFSLYFASFYFQDNKMLDRASAILREQLREQILSDGAHYELSPMYHCILLDRLLDCINITKCSNKEVDPDRWEAGLIRVAQKMCGWLAAIQYRNGEIPLLNDSAVGIAPTPRELFDYALRLGLNWQKADLTDSGYRKLDFGEAELVLDAGAIGPDYIPGHAHADTFNYELRLRECPFIIDTGVSTYNKNERRQYERGTEAHNTVVIDERDSSEVWGGFRVAQRARILSVEENDHSVIASHDGYGIIHKRHFTCSENDLEIRDELSHKCSATNYIILHPNIKIIEVNQTMVKTDRGLIELEGHHLLSVEFVKVSSEYNKLISTNRIRINFSKEMRYRITWK